MAPAAGSGATAAAAAAEEMRWRQLDSGVSAVSFGFVATAILVSMFLAMAILEHFLRPPAHAPGHAPPRGILRRLRLFLGRGGERGAAPGADLEAARKLQGHAPLEVLVTAHCSRTLSSPPAHPWRHALIVPSPSLFSSAFCSRVACFSLLCVSAHLMDLIANLVGPRFLSSSGLCYARTYSGNAAVEWSEGI
jgi:hypothetical protein